MSSPSSSSSSSSSSVAFSLSSRTLRSQRAPPSCEARAAFVPFSWEEKPGVPKQQQQQNNPSTEIIASHHHSESAHCPQREAADHHFPLRKPPCLEKPINGDHAGDRAASSAPINKHRTLLRKQSNRNLRVEDDDPFVMAIQACRNGYYEAPIRVFYENNESHHELPAGRCSHEFESRSFTIEAGTVELKHLTIRQLFTQHLQEEEELKNQKEPLIITHSKHRKKSATPFSILASCLGYNKSYNSRRR